MQTCTFQVDELYQICTPPGVMNRAGHTPLSVASAGGHLDTVRHLVEVCHCDPKRELIFNPRHACTLGLQ